MSVPKVRNAVHKATAPREYALPKTRERAALPVSASAPCMIGATPLSAGYIEDGNTPLFNSVPGDVAGTPIVVAPRGINDGKTSIPPGGSSGGTPPVSGAVPEPHAWLQLIVGFTLIGGAVRMARKRPTEEEEALLDRVEDLKNQA